MRHQFGIGAVRGLDRHRRHRHLFVADRGAVSRAAMVPHHAQHVVAVLLEAGEGAELGRHFRRGGVGNAGHDRGQRGADRAAGIGIIRNARRHQETADIGVAETQRAEFVGEPGDFLRRELRHQHRDFQHHGPQPHRVLITLDVELLGHLVAEGEQVERGEVAGGVVEEHVFRARIAGADLARGRAGVPVVDRGVVLQAGIGAGPGGVADLLPQGARLQGLGDLAGLAPGQVPVAVGFDRAQEFVGDAHRIVGVLAGDGEIGLRIPVGVVDREIDIGIALLGELDHALDVIVGDVHAPRRLDLAAQRRVLVRIEAVVVGAFAIHAGLQDRLEMLLVDPGAGDQRSNLLLLLHLPVDILLDIGMVGIDHHHLGGAARGAAGLDRARGAVADLQKRHQAGRFASARQLFAFAAQAREVRAGTGAVFEQARLAHPQIHDAAFIHQVVVDALDEAGMRLRVFVGGFRLGQFAGLEVDIEMALRGTVDAIGPVQAGVEPLRRVRRAHLHRQHVAQFVEEGLRVVLGVEIAALPAPIGPGAGQAIEYLLGGMLADIALALGEFFEHDSVGDRAPDEGGDGILLEFFQPCGHPGLAEILLRQHVGGDLRPEVRHLDIVEPEHDGAVGILDLAGGQAECDLRVGRLTVLGVAPLDLHCSSAPFVDRCTLAPALFRGAGLSSACAVRPVSLL